MVKINNFLPHFCRIIYWKYRAEKPGDGISETLKFKIFWGSMPPDPPSCKRLWRLGKIYSRAYIFKIPRYAPVACKAYFSVRSIWTVKKWFQGRGCLPLLIGSRVKRKKPPGLGLIRPVVPCRRKWFITKVFQRFWLKIGNFSIFLS